MKRIIAATFVAAFGSVGLVGCGTGSPGGPGVTSKDKETHTSTTTTPTGKETTTTTTTTPTTKESGTSVPTVGTTENTFTLSVPGNLPPNQIKQGETKQYTFGIKRGKNFDQEVAITFDKLPAGVTTEPAAPVVKRGETEVKIGFKAADDAAPTKYTMKVVGHPSTGADATNEFTLNVEKK